MVRADDAADVRYVCEDCDCRTSVNPDANEKGMYNRQVDCDGPGGHSWVAEYV